MDWRGSRGTTSRRRHQSEAQELANDPPGEISRSHRGEPPIRMCWVAGDRERALAHRQLRPCGADGREREIKPVIGARASGIPAAEASRDGRRDGGHAPLPADIFSTSVRLGALARIGSCQGTDLGALTLKVCEPSLLLRRARGVGRDRHAKERPDHLRPPTQIPPRAPPAARQSYGHSSKGTPVACPIIRPGAPAPSSGPDRLGAATPFQWHAGSRPPT